MARPPTPHATPHGGADLRVCICCLSSAPVPSAAVSWVCSCWRSCTERPSCCFSSAVPAVACSSCRPGSGYVSHGSHQSRLTSVTAHIGHGYISHGSHQSRLTSVTVTLMRRCALHACNPEDVGSDFGSEYIRFFTSCLSAPVSFRIYFRYFYKPFHQAQLCKAVFLTCNIL